MAFIFLSWFLMYEAYHIKQEPRPHFVVSSADFRQVSETDLPLVFSWSVMYLQARHDLPPSLSDRSYYLTEGKSTDEVALRKLSRWVPLNVTAYHEFLENHPRFFVCGFPSDAVFHSLIDGGSKLTLLQSRRFREGEVILVHVDRGAGGKANRPDRTK